MKTRMAAVSEFYALYLGLDLGTTQKEVLAALKDRDEEEYVHHHAYYDISRLSESQAELQRDCLDCAGMSVLGSQQAFSRFLKVTTDLVRRCAKRDIAMQRVHSWLASNS